MRPAAQLLKLGIERPNSAMDLPAAIVNLIDTFIREAERALAAIRINATARGYRLRRILGGLADADTVNPAPRMLARWHRVMAAFQSYWDFITNNAPTIVHLG